MNFPVLENCYLKSSLAERLLLLAIVGIFFVLYTFAIGDGDLFWHIKTGEYIVNNRSLPQTDPFSYTSSMLDSHDPLSTVSTVILKQYWIAQIFLYYIWSVGGAAGIVILRAFIYSALLLSVYSWSRQKSNIPGALGIMIMLGTYLPNFTNERPQLFSYPLMLLVLYILEKMLSCPKSKFTMNILPAVMILWSNMHGAYLLGDMAIGIYLISNMVNSIRQKTTFINKTSIILFISIICSFINPTGINGLYDFISNTKPNYITEYYSPYYILTHYNIYNLSFWLSLILGLYIVVKFYKSIALHHLLLICAVSFLSLTAYRHTPYSLIILPVVSGYLTRINRKFIVATVIAGSVLFVSKTSFSSLLDFGTDRFFPEKSSRILNEVKPDGRIFNHISWGGFLILNNPSYPVFTDGRGLSQRVISRYFLAYDGPKWKEVFNYYNINTVLVPILVLNEASPIIIYLLKEENWDVLSYADNEVLFLKKTPQNIGIITRYGSKKYEFMGQLKRVKGYEALN